MRRRESEGILNGTPASPGVAKGKVRIILGFESLNKMNHGDILVTKFTNPLFTPAILMASAVVTDEGGTLCHAAIVSRELGIPCVVGTQKATKILSDNEEIVVDGEKGEIERCQA